MGGNSSSRLAHRKNKKNARRPAQTLTTTPWRQPSHWNKSLEDNLLADINKLLPKKKLSILLIGPVGAGKSSFINAIQSISKGRKVDIARTKESETSVTKKLDTYTDEYLLKKYQLKDCMGLDQADATGLHLDDIVSLVKGHVKDQYEFNPSSPINSSSEYYRAKPKFEDQMHCVVFVMNAVGVYNDFPQRYKSKIADLQVQIDKLEIPRLLILTHADALCKEVEQNVDKMFWSIKVKEAVKTTSEVFNIPQASIHPVKNYEAEIALDTATNIHLLLALRQMMQYADDRMSRHQSTCPSPL